MANCFILNKHTPKLNKLYGVFFVAKKLPFTSSFLPLTKKLLTKRQAHNKIGAKKFGASYEKQKDRYPLRKTVL